MRNPQTLSDNAVRRMAKRLGLVATKSRRRESCDNYGGWCVVDAYTNSVVAGGRFELTNGDVMELLANL